MWKTIKYLFKLITDPRGREYFRDEKGTRRWITYDGMSTGLDLDDKQTVENILIKRARYRAITKSRHKKGEH